jgi:hypothetical protein
MQKSLGRSLLIPGVYGGVVLLVFLLALFARGFSEGVGDARIAGRYAPFPLFRSRTLQSLTLSWNGMALRFSRSMSPALEGYQRTEAGTDIVLGGNVRLRVTPGNDFGGSLVLTPVTPSGWNGGATLLIPFNVSGLVKDTGAGSALSWERNGRTCSLVLPAGARVDAASRLLILSLNGAAGDVSFRMAGMPLPTARVRAGPSTGVSPSPRLPDETAMPSPEQMQAAVARFVDAAYAGWTGTRFYAADALWKMPDGSARFSEDIGVGLLAESIARGTWERLLPVWSEALATEQRRAAERQLTFQTSPYVGNPRDFVRALQARAATDIDRASGLLSRRDPTIFAAPGIVALLADHGSPAQLQSALELMTSGNVAGSDTDLTIGVLEALVEYAQVMGSSDAVARATREVIDRQILPAMRTTDAGIFLQSDKAGQADVMDSVRCGSLLLRAGTALEYTRATAIGRGLIVASLGLAGETGFLPARITLSSGRVSAREGGLAPESLYALLPLDRRVPKEIPLSRQVGPGSWIWTSAKLVSVDGTEEETRLVMAYPAGIPHHIALQGIRSIAQIHLHGIPWRTDPLYAKYSDGWAYDHATETLYIKLTGRGDQEEIDIRY